MSQTASIPLSEAANAWMRAHVEGFSGAGVLDKFAFGQSNPTYRLHADSGDYVLRRKPTGVLLPKAHAIEREFRVLQALQSTPAPTPRVFALCEDASLIGAPFYVMEFVQGRIFYDQCLPGMAPADRAQIYDAMNQAVACLHSVDAESAGLGDYGRPERFLARQVDLWTKQYRAAEDVRKPAMEALIDWLPVNLPPEQRGAIFHGDLRLDNMVFHPTEPRVVALLDWELSTLGDPIADLAYNAMVWRVPASLFRGLADLDRAAMGIPEEAEYLQRYCERTVRSHVPDWRFYLAFSVFRVAAILQGVARRARDGNASAVDAAEVGAKAGPLSELAWSIASGPRC